MIASSHHHPPTCRPSRTNQSRRTCSAKQVRVKEVCQPHNQFSGVHSGCIPAESRRVHQLMQYFGSFCREEVATLSSSKSSPQASFDSELDEFFQQYYKFFQLGIKR